MLYLQTPRKRHSVDRHRSALEIWREMTERMKSWAWSVLTVFCSSSPYQDFALPWLYAWENVQQWCGPWKTLALGGLDEHWQILQQEGTHRGSKDIIEAGRSFVIYAVKAEPKVLCIRLWSSTCLSTHHLEVAFFPLRIPYIFMSPSCVFLNSSPRVDLLDGGNSLC